jgi:aminoglycoside 6'-N-acetyltransferase I
MDLVFCDLRESSELRVQAARILMRTFLDLGNPAWPNMHAASKEVEECLVGERFCVGAATTQGVLAGWVGLRPMYERTWELHPMVVARDHQNRGVGHALLDRLEGEARARGIEGIVLGTDDEDGRTSLSAVDLDGTNLFAEIANVRNLGGHPFEFYRKCGYAIVGVIPNANGYRKPDIWMWKDLRGG